MHLITAGPVGLRPATAIGAVIVALMLAVALVPGEAQASAKGRGPEAAGARPTPLDVAMTTTGPTAMAAVTTNYIANGTAGVGLGVMHVRDGSYVHGSYDAVLPPGAYTDGYFGWTTTAGWFTGAGYCTYQYRNDDGGSVFTRQLPDLGAGQHFIGSRTRYLVYAYHC
jgi:hypothetical protein